MFNVSPLLFLPFFFLLFLFHLLRLTFPLDDPFRRIYSAYAEGDCQSQNNAAEDQRKGSHNDARRDLELFEGHRQDQDDEEEPDRLGEDLCVVITAVHCCNQHGPAQESGKEVSCNEDQKSREDTRDVKKKLRYQVVYSRKLKGG